MDTASEPPRIYLFICSRYRGRLAAAAQRQSNNADPDFTDEEVLTIYVFGLIKKRSTISEIHEYVEDHFSDWFPDLPSYQSYNRRLNRLSAVFAPLVQEALSFRRPSRKSVAERPGSRSFALPTRCRLCWRRDSGPPRQRWPPID